LKSEKQLQEDKSRCIEKPRELPERAENTEQKWRKLIFTPNMYSQLEADFDRGVLSSCNETI